MLQNNSYSNVQTHKRATPVLLDFTKFWLLNIGPIKSKIQEIANLDNNHLLLITTNYVLCHV